MGLSVASGTKLPAGSGRTLHLIFPRFLVRNSGGTPSTIISARQGVELTGGATQTASGTGTCTWNAAAVNGAIVAGIRTPLVADYSSYGFNVIMFPILEQQGNDQQPGYPCSVWRYIAQCAFPALPGAIGVNTDLGLEVIPANNTSINFGGLNRAGIMFGPVSDTQIGLRIRRVNGGALTLQRDLTFAQAGVADVTKFNTYEVRIISGTGSSPAKLKAFINGRAFGAEVDCSAAAAIVPAIDNSGNGFKAQLASGLPSAAYTFWFTEQHLICSAFEDDAG